jgi:hypothetical protein
MSNTKHLETKNGEKNLYVVNDLSKNENVARRTMLMCASVMEIKKSLLGAVGELNEKLIENG